MMPDVMQKSYLYPDMSRYFLDYDILVSYMLCLHISFGERQIMTADISVILMISM